MKKKIERYSPINTSMALPESDTKLKPDDSGLLITSSNETSLVNIMKGMTPPIPPIPKQKKMKAVKRIQKQIKTMEIIVKIKIIIMKALIVIEWIKEI